MKKLPLGEASVAQLRSFARDHLGLDVANNSNRETLMARISAAWDKDEIVLADEPEAHAPSGAAPRPASAEQAGPEPGKVRIVIQVSDKPGGDRPVEVGVNGKVMLIPRAKPVDIPVDYEHALSHCVEKRYDPMPDGNGYNPVPRLVHVYPYQIIAWGPKVPRAKAAKAA